MEKEEMSEVAELLERTPFEDDTNSPRDTSAHAEPNEPEAETDTRPMVEKSFEAHVLKCLLTEKEMKDCAEQMAKVMGDLTYSEADLKSVAAQYKAVIAKHEQKLSEEAAKYRAGHEFRTVQVKVIFDYEVGRVVKTRTDNLEVIEDRAMTSKEAQRKIWPET